jgi:hypothetical protein
LLDERKRRTWAEEKHLVAFTFIHPKIPYQEIDVLLRSPVPFDAAYTARRVLGAGAATVPVMSIDHLIVMKRHAGREQDLSDIATLERIKQLRDKNHHG